MKSLSKNFLILFLVFFGIAAIFSFLYNPTAKVEVVGTNQLISYINNEELNKIEVDGNKITLQLKTGETKEVTKESGESFSNLLANYDIDKTKLANTNIVIKTDPSKGLFVGTILPFLIPFILIAGFIWFMMRQVQGANNRAMSFGQAMTKEVGKQKTKKRIVFNDVAGAKEAKEELLEIVEFLKSPKKFIALGAKIPKGVLLMGNPGTGKTLMARAVAGEANVPFFHISGSEFVEMFVGVGASRVRDLFNKAKRNSPCIVFIDEIDAVGRQRGSGLGGSHDEREQTLNQILVEMDGFDNETNVIVVAATNRPDVLDPALLRPGRFDRRVVIDLPDINDREAILKIHARNKPLAELVSLRNVAERTVGFSGADLENLLNEAAILTARRNMRKIGKTEVYESIEKVILGPERKSAVISDKEKKITAYHEAGHALVGHMLTHTDPVQKISIISRGRAGGYTLATPTEDKHLYTKSEMLDRLTMIMGGYATEILIFGEVTTGPSNDLQKATALAKSLITEYGMDEKLGPRTFGQREEMIFLGKEIHERRDFSEHTAQIIDEQTTALLKNALAQAKETIVQNQEKLEKIVKMLLEKETIERDEFATIMDDKPHSAIEYKKVKTV
jgi:cell division protease FtsH